ncbi:hypothetical protein E4U52_001979 [Claviceps spartinae]|nr:hypothetical protein E4U52_001979 [Claviceps spartinae]
MAGSSDDNAWSSNGHGRQQDSLSPDNMPAMSDHIPDNSSMPKPKRLACMICRRRKLKCDGVRPSCSTCSRLGHSCAYDEHRRKSGPKRGYVKALEERLKQVETLLKTQDPIPPTPNSASKHTGTPTSVTNISTAASQSLGVVDSAMGMAGDGDMEGWHQFSSESSPQVGAAVDDFNFNSRMGVPANNSGEGNFSWEMIGLGLEEPLPPQETIDELHRIYFEKIHPSMPMIHRYRYLAAMNLAPNQRPPVCLRYAMWTMASSVTDKFANLKDLFYQRARKYVEADCLKGYGEHLISVAQCQTHILLAAYEMKMMYFPRTWINTGSAIRVAQMIGLHRLDGTGLDVKQCLPPPKDWTEREERRRTFWMAFCEDRYTSIGTGWPMTIDERDIMTNMPSSEEAFEMSRPELTQTLAESTAPSGAAKLSPFGGVVLTAYLFGRNLIHLHRPDDDDLGHDLNGPFWKRHRQIDSILLSISHGLPAHLKLPSGLSNSNIIFTNMSIHTSVICLHQAAIFKADKNKLAASVGSESKIRCITAANEITSIMRSISHTDLSAMNPFMSFCLYVAARVFVQYLKSRPDDTQTANMLRFLLSAMDVLKQRNPLTESFLVQLDIDAEALSTKVSKLRSGFSQNMDSSTFGSKVEHAGPLCTDAEGVQGILAYRECDYMKSADDDANPCSGQDGALDTQAMDTGRAASLSAPPSAPPSASASGLSGMDTFADQSWLATTTTTTTDQASFPGLVNDLFDTNPSTNPHLTGFPDLNTESCSEGPTPNSSSVSGSDVRGARAASSTSGMFGPGSRHQHQHQHQHQYQHQHHDTAFNPSPISPHDELLHPGGGASHPHQGFYDNGSSGFGMSQDMSAQQQQQQQQQSGVYSMQAATGATGWADVLSGQGQAQGQQAQVQGPGPGQTAGPDMTAVGGGVLRALMNMGPMDAMDLSSWDAAAHDSVMRG